MLATRGSSELAYLVLDAPLAIYQTRDKKVPSITTRRSPRGAPLLGQPQGRGETR